MTIGWHFDNSYSRLPKTFRENINPVAVNAPEILILNKDLANKLDLDFSNINDDDLSKIFSGNILPEGSNSIAQAYAGHQFGHFTMLGDGRAVLIGEHLTKNNERFDIEINNLLTLGITHFSNRKYPEANNTFDNVLKLDEENFVAVQYKDQISKIYSNLHEKELLNQEAEKYYQLGIKFFNRRSYEESEEQFQNAVSLIADYKD